MEASILTFFHSLLRYGVLITVAAAGLLALVGYLRSRPILSYERSMSIIAMVLCHVQLAVGLILYAMRFKAISRMDGRHLVYWKYEHITTMVLAITLITVGRMLAKRAEDGERKQLLVAVFYLIGLALMLWATPWPFREIGRDLGWL